MEIKYLHNYHALFQSELHYFEGVIKQEYGGGKMKIWDSGTFDLVEKKGKKFVANIKGKKLTGKYSLVRFQPSDIPRLDKWLFFKT